MPRSAILLLPLLAFFRVAATRRSPLSGGFVFETARRLRGRRRGTHWEDVPAGELEIFSHANPTLE